MMMMSKLARTSFFAFTIAFGLVIMSHTYSFASLVLANDPSPGDSFTNATTSNLGQAVGASGWYYNNVRNSGEVGVNTTYQRSGNGSVELVTTFGPGGNSSKADIEYLSGGTIFGGNYVATTSMGLFSNLVSMQYDWYRNAASIASPGQQPSLRVLLDKDGNLATTNDRGGLVFEVAYNGGGAVPTDSWTTSVVGSGTYLWNFGLGLGTGFNINGTAYAYDATLQEWQNYLDDAVIIGFSSGVGSGWGAFSGAVDNIGWVIGTASSTYNFEVDNGPVATPEPASMFLLGAGAASMAFLRRRNANRA